MLRVLNQAEMQLRIDVGQNADTAWARLTSKCADRTTLTWSSSVLLTVYIRERWNLPGFLRRSLLYWQYPWENMLAGDSWL